MPENEPQSTEQRKAVWVSPEVHAWLDRLATADRRGIGGQAEHLIESEMIRRGLIGPVLANDS